MGFPAGRVRARTRLALEQLEEHGGEALDLLDLYPEPFPERDHACIGSMHGGVESAERNRRNPDLSPSGGEETGLILPRGALAAYSGEGYNQPR